MSMVVEDGSIVTGADSYVTLTAYQSYGAARGWTLGDDDAEDEINLRRAFDSINRSWSYLGHRESADQVGAWPRTICDGIPQAIKDAQCELAYLIQGGLDPFATISESSTSSTIKVGPITIDEETTPTGKPRIVAVEGLLKPYLRAGAGMTSLSRA